MSCISALLALLAVLAPASALAYDSSAPLGGETDAVQALRPLFADMNARGYGWVMDAIARGQTRIDWMTDRDPLIDASGGYSAGDNRIVLLQPPAEVPQAYLEVVLVHEATHLLNHLDGRYQDAGSEACYSDEASAFDRQALFWQEMYGPQGKSSAHWSYEREMNRLVGLRQEGPGAILLDVHGQPAYQAQCDARQ